MASNPPAARTVLMIYHSGCVSMHRENLKADSITNKSWIKMYVKDGEGG